MTGVTLHGIESPDSTLDPETLPEVLCSEWQRIDLTESVYTIIMQKLISAQIRQLILYMRKDKGYVNGFVRGSTFSERLCEPTDLCGIEFCTTSW